MSIQSHPVCLYTQYEIALKRLTDFQQSNLFYCCQLFWVSWPTTRQQKCFWLGRSGIQRYTTMNARKGGNGGQKLAWSLALNYFERALLVSKDIWTTLGANICGVSVWIVMKPTTLGWGYVRLCVKKYCRALQVTDRGSKNASFTCTGSSGAFHYMTLYSLRSLVACISTLVLNMPKTQ